MKCEICCKTPATMAPDITGLIRPLCMPCASATLLTRPTNRIAALEKRADLLCAALRELIILLDEAGWKNEDTRTRLRTLAGWAP